MLEVNSFISRSSVFSFKRNNVGPFSNHRENLRAQNGYWRRTRYATTKLFAREKKYYEGLDAYEILEVPRGATLKEIKQAFHKKVSQWHPDKHLDPVVKEEANKRMIEINNAYYMIGEEDRRRRYDMHGAEGVGTSAASEDELRNNGGMGGMFGGQGGFADGIDLSDLFSSMFQGGMGFDESSSAFGGGGGKKSRGGKQAGKSPL